MPWFSTEFKKSEEGNKTKPISHESCHGEFPWQASMASLKLAMNTPRQQFTRNNATMQQDSTPSLCPPKHMKGN
jgi:hypothetical protein